MENTISETKASAKDWLAVWAVVLGTFMAIIDITITNSSLQDIQGSLSASLVEGAWISTSYLVTEIIIIPLAAFFAHIFSLKKYLLINVIVFLVFSVLCGLAWDLNSMIVFRAFQGLAGGALIPTAITVIVTRLPLSQQVIGFTIFGIATTIAPALGPSLGGWITSEFGWPFIFYVNLIPGMGLIYMIINSLENEPTHIEELKHTDWWGILWMSLFLSTLTVVLEEGNREDWLSSPHIAILSGISLISFLFFLYVELTNKNPVVHLRLLKRKNFLASCLLSFFFGFNIYAPNLLIPTYLGGVQGYSSLDIGLVMMWLGLPQLLIMPFIPKLSEKIDARVLTGIGFVLYGISFLMNSELSFDYGGSQMTWSLVVRALGIPFIITPSTSIAYDKIEPENIGHASGLVNMIRNLGGSVGIGLMGTMLSRRYSVHFDQLSEQLSYADQASTQRLGELSQSFIGQGSTPVDAYNKAIMVMNGILNRESMIMSYSDCFLILAVSSFLTISLLFFMNKLKGSGGGASH
jgi:DHA2 family multidrug resistance protein